MQCQYLRVFNYVCFISIRAVKKNEVICDKCSSPLYKIGNQTKCACGVWGRSEQLGVDALEDAILFYNEQCKKSGDYSPLTGDHNTGTCFVIWRGNYEMCQEVRDFIASQNHHPENTEEK